MLQRFVQAAIVSLLLGIVALPTAAQQVAHVPTVRTSGTAVLSLEADVATLTVEFSATRDTPGEAGRANAAQANGIRAALYAVGVHPDSVLTRGYNAAMNVRDYARDTSFVATNTMVARMRDLSIIGAAIDTALAEGATRISGLNFASTESADAAERVLMDATRLAHRRAQLMAEASGGRLGDLVEITTEPPGYTSSMFSLDQIVVTGTGGARTTIDAPSIEIRVTVYGTWRYEPSSPEP